MMMAFFDSVMITGVVTPFEWVMIIAAVVGAGTSAYGQQQQAKAQKAQADYNAEVQRNEAVMAERKATADAEAAAREKRGIRQKARRIRATQEAGFAGAGVVMEGTPLAFLADTTMKEEEDILNIKRADDLNQMGLEYTQQNLLSQADFMQSQSSAASKVANVSAGATLAAGLGQAAYGYNKYKKPATNS